MYPLPAVLVNCPDSIAPDLRGGLDENGVIVAAESHSVDQLLDAPPRSHDTQKRLFIVRVQSLDETTAIARLASTFPGQPILGLVEGDYDAMALFQVSRAGAAQILPVPFARPDLGVALDRLLLQFGVQKTESRVIAVGGVVEGVGATTTAVELAAQLTGPNRPLCVLTELNAGLGRLAGLLNVEPGTSTADILAKPEGPALCDVQVALTKVMKGLSVLVGPYASLLNPRPAPGATAQFVRVLRQAAGVVVVDMPNIFDEEYFEVLGLVDDYVLVVRQDVPSLQAARLVVHELRERGMPDPMVVVNMYQRGEDAFSNERITKLLGVREVFPVQGDSAGVRAAMNFGTPLSQTAPNSPTVRDLRPITAELLRAAGATLPVERPTMWSRMRAKFSLVAG